MKIWMAITSDVYELPITFGESCGELARLIGSTWGNVMKKYKEGGRNAGYAIVVVDIEEGEMENNSQRENRSGT